MRFFTNKTKKLSRVAQKGLAPRKEFIEHGKERFLAAFDASSLAHNAHPAYQTRPAYITAFFKIGVGAMAALCVAVGVSAYADTTNVSATSPFYPLKRLTENVQLAVAPTSEKAQLQATFAVRRANEIEALQTSQPSSRLIPKLTSDLDEDISSSLNLEINNEGSGRGRGGRNFILSATSTASSTFFASTPTSTDAGLIGVYCGAFNVSTSGVFIGRLENNLALHPRALAEFNRRCGSTKSDSDHDNNNEDGGDGNGNTTTTPTSTITATSSFDGHIYLHGLPIPHIGGHD